MLDIIRYSLKKSCITEYCLREIEANNNCKLQYNI